MPRYANDPQEPQIRYDLYRIPFDGGRGGRAEPLAGASANGMSNTFPKISPDGRWIVFVRSRNGMLMRPDSQLYIVPASGGEARRMRANLSPMNSWHSFSPNGRWLVFASKARSPYTQLYLTHIDEQGNDSPAILIENTTAANRAANLPEFVNLPPDGLAGIDGPALEYFRLVNRAVYAQKQGLHEDAAARWRRVLELRPDDEGAHRGLGSALLMAGRRDEAASHIRRAEELKLRAAIENGAAGAAEHSELGRLLLDSGRLDEAAAELDKALALQPDFAPSLTSLGRLLARQGKLDQALDRLRAAAASVRLYAPASYQLGLVLEMKGDASGAEQAWRTALSVDPGLADAHLSLARALEARGLSAEALAHWRAVVAARPNDSEALRRAAWLLATSPEASLRNGEEAVALAARSVSLSSGRDAASLDALAAAYAESHRFADAVATARQALSLAEPAGGPLPADIRNRIKLYQSSTPFRDR
jgi:tetratricopeptide (TPR) repeat protein